MGDAKTVLVGAIGVTLESKTFGSDAEALAYMSRPENLAPFAAYEAEVKRRAEDGLDGDDLATFRLWWGGGKVDWDSVSDRAYGAIMQAISMGCG